jgi:hypothetical protein
MSDYRIEKIRRSISVVLADGTRLDGEVFLRPLSRYRPRPEEPGELLNDADPFFVLIRNGEAVLIAKAGVAFAETTVPIVEEEFEIAALGVPVEVTLTDGTVCAGSIFLETRSDRPRLLDFLNSYSARFLPVLDPTHVLLVNTRNIAHVREVE